MRRLVLGLLAAACLAACCPASALTVVPAGAAIIKKAIAADKGHVVVVNFWATWCGPCVAEFPALVRFQSRYSAKGVVVMAVSADMRKDRETKVMPFLVKQGATFPQYLEQSPDPEDFINAFDPNWGGDLPRTFIYDRQGRLVKELSGGQPEAAFAQAVIPWLKK